MYALEPFCFPIFYCSRLQHSKKILARNSLQKFYLNCESTKAIVQYFRPRFISFFHSFLFVCTSASLIAYNWHLYLIRILCITKKIVLCACIRECVGVCKQPDVLHNFVSYTIVPQYCFRILECLNELLSCIRKIVIVNKCP